MELKRLFDFYPYQKEKYPQAESLNGKSGGKWVKNSTQEVIDKTDSIALGLLDLGLQKGDMIAIMSINRIEWTLMDQAIMKMGGIVVPIYPTSSEADLEYIFNHAGIKAVFAADEDLYNRIHGLKDKIPTEYFFTFEQVNGARNYMELSKDADDAGRAKLKEIQDSIGEMDLATIIYTSGTTGNPKGVMLSHKNVVSNVLNTRDLMPLIAGDVALSFLPLSHIFERMIIYLYVYAGINVFYAESLETIGDNLKEIRPHVFTAVPRLLEKVYDRIQAGGMANTGLKKTLFEAMTKMALQWQPDGQNGGWYEFRLGILDKLVASKIRAKAGLDRVKACASGSAALQPRLSHYYNGIGIPLVEGYGLTETSPVISVGGFTPGAFKVGQVGRVIPQGDCRIAEDGEIIYKGPNVMMGYYKNEEKTKEVIDENGYFHTGDIGVIDADGFLKITDRKKEMFKTSGGKYIAPQLMENKFKESLFIEQICVIGEYKKFPGALIVPNFEHLTAWCKENNISVDENDHKAMVSNDAVQKKFQEEVDHYNASFAKWEKIKKFEILPRELSIDGGELTPTLKVKRKVVNEHFASEINKIYGE